ncbi:MAG: hypothetical protein QMD85_03745 [Candidatus Aenigmarchaeota archaeon]|nr:hypothetical protein [Candidatus Aenigmarchaeota archaeon]MDI6722672.1 hypothetical protein [Candidatus Aenigmarchaeota archaeon]
MNITDSLKIPNMKKYIAIFIIAAIFVFITGRIYGFTVAEENYNNELLDLKLQLNLFNRSYERCVSDISVRDSRISSLESEKTGLTSSVASLNANLGTCNTDLSSAKQDVSLKENKISSLTSENDILSRNYNSLAANSANALCCVKKIFDNSLVAYYAESNAIICTSDRSKTVFKCN